MQAEQSWKKEVEELKQLRERGPILPAYATIDIETLQKEIEGVIKRLDEKCTQASSS